MSRRWLWLPLIALVALATVLGLRAGWRYATLTETDVINAYAAHYLADRKQAGTGQGARLTDCVAFPAAPEDRGIWLIVSCGPTPFDPALSYEYAVSRAGRLVEQRGPGDWAAGRGGT